MADCTSNSFDCKLQKASTIKQMKAKDQQLQSQIDSINKQIGSDSDASIGSRLSNLEECCEDRQDEISQVNTVISEIGDNITLLKGMYTRQDGKIKSLLRNVILDETYRNFSDWVENVYIPQGESLENKYTQGDIYMNVNQDVGATNAVYVCIRSYNSKQPLSANDWQELYYSAPSDVQAILGIDPVEVTHPYKHEWVISINPDKLSDMLAQLTSLDLSNVDVTLGDVYFNPTIKESVTIQENLTVGNITTLNHLEANDAQIDKACIEEMTCDTNFTGTPTFLDAKLSGTFDIHEIDSDTATIDNACINKMNCNTDFTDTIPEFGTANVNTQLNVKRTEGERAHFKKACIEEMVCDTKYEGKVTAGEGDVTNLTVETLIQEGGTAEFNGPVEFNGTVELNIVEGDTTFNDIINAPDVNITNNTTTENITVNNTTTLNGPVNINSYVNLVDEDGRDICLLNIAKNLFRPSYGLFQIHGGGVAYAGNGVPNPLYGLGSDGIRLFNEQQGANKVPYVPYGTQNATYENNTYLERDKDNTTPGVELTSDNLIYIHGENGEDAGLYTIEFNMTIGFDDVSDNTPYNLWSHRAGVVVYNATDLKGRIIDDKFEVGQNLFKFTYTHSHSYWDSDTGEDSSGSSNRTTQPNILTISNPDRCATDENWTEAIYRVGKFYTYTKTLTIPVNSLVIVAPYLKPSSGCEGRGLHFKFAIPEGVWNTGSESQIFVHKVANLGAPYEYHC